MPFRPLDKLPKAHLHLHFGQAAICRETLEEWAASDAYSEQCQIAKDECKAKVEEYS